MLEHAKRVLSLHVAVSDSGSHHVRTSGEPLVAASPHGRSHAEEIGWSDRENLDVVGEAGTVAAAVAGINALKPDVVLLDMHLPDGGGPACSRRGRGRPGLPCVELASAVRRVAGGAARL
jgi:CheY-like chemotaxis protein